MKLSSVSSSAGRPNPDRVLIYGRDKVGKTSFAAGAPASVWICAESGIPPHIDVQRFPSPRNSADVVQALKELTTQDHEFRSVVIDSLDWLDHLIRDEIMAEMSWSIDDFDKYGRGYSAALEKHRAIIRALDALQAAKGVQVVVICHAEAKNVRNPRGDDYVHISPKVGGQKAPALWKEWVDSLLYAEVEVVVADTKDRQLGKARVTGDRVIYTRPGNGYDAGSRYDIPEVLPLYWASYADARDAARQPGKAADLYAEAMVLVEALGDDPRAPTARKHIEAHQGDAVTLGKALRRLTELTKTPKETVES